MAGTDTTAAASSALARRAAERRIARGLALSLLLAVASGVAGVWRSIDARQRLAELTSQEVDYYRQLSEIGRDAARLRSAALEEARAENSPTGVTPPLLRLRTLAEGFDRKVAALDGLLASRGHDLGEGLRGSLTSFRQALDRFEAAVTADDADATGRALDELLVLTSRVQSTLDAVLEESRAGALTALARTDAELGRSAAVEILISLLLVAGLAAVWMSVLRASRSASRLMADQLARTEQANRDLDAFAGRVAHDFRNVISPLPLLSGRLRRGRVTDLDAAADQLERVAQRGDALISGLLAFSRLGAAPEEHGASVRETVLDVLDELSPLVASSGARVELDVDETEVACAPPLLHLVLANVLTNAMKYLDGSQTRRVWVESRPQADGVSIEIKDSGPGIPPEHLGRVFEPFFRVPGSSAEGTGLGLPTVKRIVEAIGGQVSLRSEEGEGTTVTLWLPLSRRASARGPSVAIRPNEQPPLTH